MIMADSSVWIDYFRGKDSPQAERLDILLGKEALVAGDIILTEVLQGFGTNAQFQTALRLMGSLDLIEIGGRRVAIQAARNFRLLRERGITVRKTIDTLIATRCILDGLPLLYNDRDFEPFVAHLGLSSAMA
ncbi:PIN domain nuclease [soil metagenome]